MGIDSLLKPASSGHLRNCTPSSASYFRPWSCFSNIKPHEITKLSALRCQNAAPSLPCFLYDFLRMFSSWFFMILIFWGWKRFTCLPRRRSPVQLHTCLDEHPVRLTSSYLSLFCGVLLKNKSSRNMMEWAGDRDYSQLMELMIIICQQTSLKSAFTGWKWQPAFICVRHVTGFSRTTSHFWVQRKITLRAHFF